MLCFSFGTSCTLSGTGAGGLTWCGLSWQDGAWVPCDLGAPILRALLQQARRQVNPEEWRQEGVSPHSLAHGTHVPPRVNHPRERLGACPGCCRQHAFLPGPTQQGWGRAPAGGLGAAGCCRVLPVPAPSKGCAAFRIFSSHCHSNRLGAWVPAMPAPASRIPQPSCPQPSPPGPGHCRYGPARPTQHSVVFGEL